MERSIAVALNLKLLGKDGQEAISGEVSELAAGRQRPSQHGIKRVEVRRPDRSEN